MSACAPRRAPSALIAVAVCAHAGCTSDVVWLEPPPVTSPPSRTMVLALQGERGLEVHAVGLDAEGTLATSVHLAVPSDASVEALLYEATPDALGIEEGPLAAATSGEVSRAVPTPEHVFATKVHAARAEGWSERSRPSELLASFRFSGGPPECARFEPEVIDLETAGDGAFAFAVDASRALIGTSDGHTYVVERSGRVSPIRVMPPRTIWAGIRGEAGDLWLGSDRGELLRGDLGDTLVVTPVATAPSGERLHWFDGGTGPDGFELFSLSIEGSFERFRLGRWAAIHTFAPAMPGLWAGGVARLDRNLAVAAWPLVATVIRADGDAPVSEDTGSLAGLSAIVEVPGFGTVAGTSGGNFIVRQDGVWRELPGSGFAFAVEVIAPYEDGFVYGGAVGNFGQWRPGIGFCALTQPAPHWIQQIAVLGEDLVLVGVNGTYPKTPITILHRMR